LNKTKGCLIANFATVPVIAWLRLFRINLDVVWETVQEWLPALLQQLPAVRQDADDEDRNDNCERGISDDC
jgi:hypothetical protein